MRITKSADQCTNKVRAAELMKLNQYSAGSESGNLCRIKDIFLATFAVAEYERLRTAGTFELGGVAEAALNDFSADTIQSCEFCELLPMVILNCLERGNGCVGDLERQSYSVVSER